MVRFDDPEGFFQRKRFYDSIFRSAECSVIYLWLMPGLYHLYHLSQPAKTQLALCFKAILMPYVLRKTYARAQIAGASRLEGTWHGPGSPQPSHSAQALGFQLIILISSTLIIAPQCPDPPQDFCMHTLQFMYPHRRMNTSTHTVLYRSQALVFPSVWFVGGDFQSCPSFAFYIFQYEVVQSVISLQLFQVSSPAGSGKKQDFRTFECFL